MDFSKVVAASAPAAHKVVSNMAIKVAVPCDCVESCNCPALNAFTKRMAKLNKKH